MQLHMGAGDQGHHADEQQRHQPEREQQGARRIGRDIGRHLGAAGRNRRVTSHRAASKAQAGNARFRIWSPHQRPTSRERAPQDRSAPSEDDIA